METTNPKVAEKVGTLHLTRSLDATAPVARTTRFPARPHDAGREGQANLESKGEGFSSSDWAESARDAVRAHPLVVVGVALVAGLLVGRL